MSDLLTSHLISIIVPIYNIENYLEICIESIINQSYRNLQIILVDDGSTDKSGKICDEYAKKDLRIYVIHKENGGLVSARKAGLERAVGKYVGFVDGDDYIDSGMYQKLYDIAEKYQTFFIHSGYYKGEDKRIYFTSQKLKQYKNTASREEVLLQLLSLNSKAEISPSLWSKLFERNFITKWYSMVPESQTYGEDMITMCYCIMNIDNFVSVPDAYYHYRYRQGSLSKDLSDEKLLKYYMLYDILKGIFLDYGYDDVALNALKKRFGIMGMQLLAELNHYYVPLYKYPQITDLYGKKIVLYGAGRVGKDYYYEISKYQNCHIMNWVDQKNYQLEYAVINNMESIQSEDYDVVLIAVLDENLASEIREQLVGRGIDQKKIIWKEPITILE